MDHTTPGFAAADVKRQQLGNQMNRTYLMRPFKGTYDAIPSTLGKAPYSSEDLDAVRSAFIQAARSAGFKEITTPILEATSLFIKSTGSSSDVVGKEMYTFDDRAGRSVTLRPEGTPGALRALANAQGHLKEKLQKVYYVGPMFRYERPQQGRHRQFTQFGIELIGAKCPMLDVDIISVAAHAFQQLGIQTRLEINTLGTREERTQFHQALVEYLTPLKDQLSEDSQKRLATNPLRILDSKLESDQRILNNAPTLQQFLTNASTAYFAQVKEALDSCGIEYRVNKRLVRGLDYYSDTVFEWVCDTIGSQSALGGGGRYSGLYEQIGGNNSDGIGFAFGLERIILATHSQNDQQNLPVKKRDIVCIPIQSPVTSPLLATVLALRAAGYEVNLEPIASAKKLSKTLQSAAQKNYRYAIIAGQNELDRNVVLIKNLETTQQSALELNTKSLLTYLSANQSAI